ncbi:Outer membrane lipoprotein pcp [Burkholderiales bacterium]|nr:Outer membrane lipoprotein pcp [Burkholderiales bacterium]
MVIAMIRPPGCRVFLSALACSVLLLAGCVPVQRADVYYPGQALRTQSVEFGFVESVREVLIGGSRTGVGGASGAVIGSIAGSHAGGGHRGSFAGSVIGAIVGGIIGVAVEEGVTQRPGIEITVRLDGGGLIAVVQDAEWEALRPGDRVRVLSDGYSTRVTR